METTKSSRRRSSKPKPENYYKILGVRSNATPASIKKKYIESVKAFPPETHPEEFQQIRRAYETLRDPLKRRDYDVIRKYGGKLEKIMEEVWELLEEERYVKAEKLVHQALALSPDNQNIRLVLAQIALFQYDFETFHEQCDLVEKDVLENDKPGLLALKARMLFETEYPEEAIRLLDDARIKYPNDLPLFLPIYTDAYLELGDEEALWQLTLSVIPAPGTETPEDLHIFIHCLNTMFDLEKWSFKSNLQQRIRKLLKSALNEEDKLMMITALQDEHDGYLDAGRFREAEIYIDFLYCLDSANPAIQQQRKQIQELMRVDKELHRLANDHHIFPLVMIYALEWFHMESAQDEELTSLHDQLPPFFNDPPGKNLEIDEMFAHGILSMRKKYPLIYRHFQDQWDELFHERIQSLGREARRHLKI